jgi:hypothetical protein
MEYRWEAAYNDGTIRSQKTGDKYSELERSKLTMFALLDEQGQPRLVVRVDPDHKLFYRTRRFINQADVNQNKTIVMAGWTASDGMMEINCLFEDGRTELYRTFDNSKDFLFPMQLSPEEM